MKYLKCQAPVVTLLQNAIGFYQTLRQGYHNLKCSTGKCEHSIDIFISYQCTLLSVNLQQLWENKCSFELLHRKNRLFPASITWNTGVIKIS